MFGRKKKKIEYDYQMEQKDKRIRLLTIEVAEIKENVHKAMEERDAEIVGLCNQLDKMTDENQTLAQAVAELIKKPERRTIGFMPIEVPEGLNAERELEYKNKVLDQMTENMKRIGLDIDLVAMPQQVRNIQVVTLDMKVKP